MRKSKSLFSQLYKKAIFYGLVDEGGWFSQMLASRKTTAEYTKLTKILLRAFCAFLWLIKSVSIRVHSWLIFLRASVPLWLKPNLSAVACSSAIAFLSSVALAKEEATAEAKADQSKQLNYAKQSQFPKKSNVYNRNFNNQLQRKTQIGHLVKTNPNKANFTPYGG
jgi:glucan phosphoethanolaminetransferase (alkaline phosphatase superfamily)